MLLRFPLREIVLISNIKQAFLNIEIREEDCVYIRFLWFKDISTEIPQITVYQFSGVVFASFLINATVKHY